MTSNIVLRINDAAASSRQGTPVHLPEVKGLGQDHVLSVFLHAADNIQNLICCFSLHHSRHTSTKKNILLTLEVTNKNIPEQATGEDVNEYLDGASDDLIPEAGQE